MGYAERLRRYEAAKKALPPMTYREYEKAIKEIPSAVVRCKDCKYGTRLVVDLAGKDGVVCCHGNINRALNWFCADGEENNE